MCGRRQQWRLLDGQSNCDVEEQHLMTTICPVQKIGLGAYKGARQGLTAEKKSILWAALDFTKRRYGHPKQIGAITSTTYFCNHCECFPLSDCTWFVCAGVSQRLRSEGEQLIFREMRAHLQLESRKSNSVLEVWL